MAELANKPTRRSRGGKKGPLQDRTNISASEKAVEEPILIHSSGESEACFEETPPELPAETVSGLAEGSSVEDFQTNQEDFKKVLKEKFNGLFQEFEQEVQELYDEVDTVVVNLAERLKREQERFFGEVSSRFEGLSVEKIKGSETVQAIQSIMKKIQEAFSVLHEEGFSVVSE